MNPKTFCIYPFTQIVGRTNGGLSACCLINDMSNIRRHNLQEFWHSDAINQLRQSMLQDHGPITQCDTCRKAETDFGSSMRTQALRDHGVNLDQDLRPQINLQDLQRGAFARRIELHIGNTCNLKCLTCEPSDSSMLLQENRVLGISYEDQRRFSYPAALIDSMFDEILDHDVDLLDLRGGESMLMPEIKQRLLTMPQRVYHHTTLRIQTNGTIYDAAWQEIFQRFQRLEIMVSVDGFGAVNDYIRFPSAWDQIQRNIDRFRAHDPANLFLNTVVSNLSLPRLDELLTWSQSAGIYCHLSPLEDPRIFQSNNLPAAVLTQAQQRLADHDHHPTVLGLLALRPLEDAGLWRDFCNMIDRRDNHRKNRIFDVLPALQQFW